MGFFGTPCSMFFPTFNIKNYNTDYEKIIILSESDCCIFEKRRRTVNTKTDVWSNFINSHFEKELDSKQQPTYCI